MSYVKKRGEIFGYDIDEKWKDVPVKSNPPHDNMTYSRNPRLLDDSANERF
jgi:hypothetical protein